ncbi:MAG: Mth938-like domain-containing protein [Candidatus Scalinduaceae bacterium]
MQIKSYEFGRIEIDNTVYTNDVIIYDEYVNPSWWRKEGHYLQIEDIEEILKVQPDIIIIGTGKFDTMKVGNAVKKELESRGIEAICLNTDEACKRHNEMSKSSKKVVAALHLTC